MRVIYSRYRSLSVDDLQSSSTTGRFNAATEDKSLERAIVLPLAVTRRDLDERVPLWHARVPASN